MVNGLELFESVLPNSKHVGQLQERGVDQNGKRIFLKQPGEPHDCLALLPDFSWSQPYGKQYQIVTKQDLFKINNICYKPLSSSIRAELASCSGSPSPFSANELTRMLDIFKKAPGKCRNVTYDHNIT